MSARLRRGACTAGAAMLGFACTDVPIDIFTDPEPDAYDSSYVSALFVGQPGAPGSQNGIGADARLGGPGDLSVDGQFMWYVDATNHVLARIDLATAEYKIIAGDALGGEAGDVDAVIGADARFGELSSVAGFGGDVYVSDRSNHKLKRVQHGNEFPVTTIAGSGVAGVDDGVGALASFDDPRGLTGAEGYLFLLDGEAALLRRYDLDSGEVVTVAGSPYAAALVDGVGSEGRFVRPQAMVGDGEGRLYISDADGLSLRMFEVGSATLTTIAGSGSEGHFDGVGTDAELHRPWGLALADGRLLFSELERHTIRELQLSGLAISTVLGQPCADDPCVGDYAEGRGASARFDAPSALAWDPSRATLFVLDAGNAVIRRVERLE